MPPFLDNLKEFLKRLTVQQQLALGAVIIGSVALLGGIAYWAGRPDYALLFGKLDPTDANKIVETLRSENVEFDLRESGTAIYVPRNEVYELRLRFAGEGVVSDGLTGYELFDQGTLGMTDFMQKLNLKRALEGELSRTISSIRQVEQCRVHLVLPERSPFRETQTQPTASVVLQLAGKNALEKEQIDGITELVAGAVEGLTANNVTILDTRGNLLSNPEQNNPDVALTTNQLKTQNAVEMHLTQNGQTMLDQFLGAGNAIVRVNASLDFTRTIAEKETIDPESQTVISEEKLDENDPEAGSASSSVKNYALSKTNERQERNVGDIKYLTVSVILNQRVPASAGDADEEDAPAPKPVPYTPAQITEIENLVKNAVGFNPERGDRIALHQTSFDTTQDEQIAAEMQNQRQKEDLQLYLRYGLMVLAIGAAIWLIRSASKRVTVNVNARDETAMLTAGGRPGALAGGDGSPALNSATRGPKAQLPTPEEEEEELVLVDDVYTSKLSPEARKRLKAKHLMYEEVKAKILEKPADTAEIMRTWLNTEPRQDKR